ncbi:alpha/beta hydrolase [Arthrobacter sp. SLBN-53]|uniref:alpha/beta hydrolase fold domain-containing protein n=1 Tax=Arthrobacter sp. SLBN-53 TaxID=2768412 RepID=UPI00135C957F|nr:alpha/beta hydrolase [Arthrobacter sp. SLBN-53]
MRGTVALWKLTTTKSELSDPVRTAAAAARRQQAGAAPFPRRLVRRFETRYGAYGSLPVIEVRRRDRPAGAVIVYLHGGAYLNPLIGHQWNLVCALADDNDARVIVVFYPLSPKGCAAVVLTALTAMHRQLVRQEGQPPIYAGDSAGGGLTLALALWLRADDTPPPRHLALFAPWLDITLRNPEIPAVETQDPTLALPGLRYAGARWAPETDVDDPDVCPINGNPEGLPPMTVIVGTRDVFRPDCRALVTRAAAAGVDAALYEARGAFHVFIAATMLPESRQARAALTRRLAWPTREAAA